MKKLTILILILAMANPVYGYAVKTETGKPGTDILLDLSEVQLSVIILDAQCNCGNAEVAKEVFELLKQFIEDNYVIIPKEVKPE